MKRISVLILAFLLLLSACGAQESPETTGPTAPPETESAEAAQGPEGVTDAPKDTVTVYVLTRMTQLDENGIGRWHREYEYDARGRRTWEYEYDSAGVMTDCREYIYDDAGLLLATRVLRAGTESTTITYAYDDRGNLILQETREGDTLVSRDEFTWDDHGNQLSCKMYADGELIYDIAYAYRYDESGNILSREEYLDGALVYTVEFSYDSQGRCTESVTRTADGTVDMRSVFVREGNTETRTYYDMEGNACLTAISTYDDQGNLIFQESTYPDGTVTMTDYTYEPMEIQP